MKRDDFKELFTDLFDKVKEEVRGLKKSQKYVDPNFTKEEKIKIFCEGDTTVCADFLETFKVFLTEKNKAPVFSWNHGSQQLMWLDKEDVGPQMKTFRCLRKQGKVRVLEENNRTCKLSKKSWHCIVVTTGAEGQIDIPSVKLFNLLVSGLVYWFDNKDNRDAYFKYITK
jgi:hypothetical protein